MNAPARTVAASVAAALAALAAASAATAAPPAGLHVSSFSAARAVVTGTRVEVSGRVAPAAPVRVLIQRSTAPGAWVVAATLRAEADGRFSGRVPLAAAGSLRAAVRTADGTVLGGPRRYVKVTRAVGLEVTAPQYQSIAGVPFHVQGTLRPGAPGDRVVVEGSRGGAYRALGTLRLRAGGTFSGAVRVDAGGTWRFRVHADATPAGQTAAEVVTAPLEVFPANPHHIPASATHYIVQERSNFRIFYYENGTLLRVFPVVFGKPSTPTPVGTFRVYSKTTGPSAAFGPLVLWYHRGYGIHGTNQEYLLSRTWRYYSHGCTRNYNANIRWLWPRVPVGTPVVNLA